MSLILNIETATKNCSVSLSDKGQIVAIKELNEGKFSHAEKLHSFILELFKEADFLMSQIDAVAVSKGPGSYTGLRIGVSTAKGLCFALDKPLISISTLESMSRQIPLKPDELAVPMIDARRMEVYSAVFDHNYQEIRDIRAEIIVEDSFEALLAEHIVYFSGDGADKCKEVIQHKNARFIDELYPSAREMAVIADRKFQEGDFEDVAYFEPFYLKDFVAGKPKKLF